MSDNLTRVTLGHVPPHLNVYLRFGRPRRQVPINRCSRSAFFAPGQVFCRIWWESNAYGTTRWELSILQAGSAGQFVQRLSGVHPGAVLLACVEGERTVRPLLRLISTIESLRVDPADVSPAYWRVLQNRLAGRVETPRYGPDRHAAYKLQRSLQR
jgi:hypothetical protein